jgi:hypothetical protein
VKFREHRGSLEESLATLVELPDRQALIEHVTKLHASFVHSFDFSKLVVEPYLMEPDDRPGVAWQRTFIVKLPGLGPIGFTDSMPIGDSDAFVHAVLDLQETHSLDDGKVASACAGIVISICRRHNQDPVAFMRWAATTAEELSL